MINDLYKNVIINVFFKMWITILKMWISGVQMWITSVFWLFYVDNFGF